MIGNGLGAGIGLNPVKLSPAETSVKQAKGMAIPFNRVAIQADHFTPLYFGAASMEQLFNRVGRRMLLLQMPSTEKLLEQIDELALEMDRNPPPPPPPESEKEGKGKKKTASASKSSYSSITSGLGLVDLEEVKKVIRDTLREVLPDFVEHEGLAEERRALRQGTTLETAMAYRQEEQVTEYKTRFVNTAMAANILMMEQLLFSREVIRAVLPKSPEEREDAAVILRSLFQDVLYDDREKATVLQKVLSSSESSGEREAAIVRMSVLLKEAIGGYYLRDIEDPTGKLGELKELLHDVMAFPVTKPYNPGEMANTVLDEIADLPEEEQISHVLKQLYKAFDERPAYKNYSREKKAYAAVALLTHFMLYDTGLITGSKRMLSDTQRERLALGTDALQAALEKQRHYVPGKMLNQILENIILEETIERDKLSGFNRNEFFDE